MSFISYRFLLLLLPVTLGAYWLVRGTRTRQAVILAASWVFYAAWDTRFLGLLILSTAVAYFAGRQIKAAQDAGTAGGTRAARRWLIAAVVVNLAILGTFKYFNFFVDSFNELLTALAPDWSGRSFGIILPIGVSFYTFQAMSYVFDVHRGRPETSSSFLEFAAYLSFFPQLVAGPIVRYGDVARDFRDLAAARLAPNAVPGLVFLSAGLFEKTVLAGLFARFPDSVFISPGTGFADGWGAAVSFGFQVFFDFSGYSLMAVGMGLLFGIRLPKNFDRPYSAKSMQDFWRRWHMTLSSWFRDYVYVPLGGNRAGKVRTLLNLALTMFLAGLWHGAAWTFVVWGLFHGALLAGERAVAPFRPAWWRGTASAVAVFMLVTVGWVIFRADSFSAAVSVLNGMAGTRGLLGGAAQWGDFALLLFMGAVTAAYLEWFPLPWDVKWDELSPAKAVRLVAGAAALFAAGFFAIPSAGAFIYFQF